MAGSLASDWLISRVKGRIRPDQGAPWGRVVSGAAGCGAPCRLIGPDPATAKDQSGGLPAQILGSAAVGVTKAVESKLKETGALPTRDGDDVRQTDMTTAQQTMKRKLAEADASPSPKVIKTKTSKKKGRRRKVRRRGRGLSIFY